jgi:hypothetical protein
MFRPHNPPPMRAGRRTRHKGPLAGKAVNLGEGVGGLPRHGPKQMVLKTPYYGTYSFVFNGVRCSYFCQ